MRIIAGQFKGLKLRAFSSSRIRPMTDRVKTSVFDVLSSRGVLDGKRVLDLFAGTGSLAIEALSRGASEAWCIDDSRTSLKIIRHNLQLLKPPPPCRLLRQDVFAFLASCPGPGFDVIFADPPFAQKLGQRIVSSVIKSRATGPGGGVLVLETSLHEPPPLCEAPPRQREGDFAIHLFTQKEFGDKRVLFYRF